jgi:hypothetical protein
MGGRAGGLSVCLSDTNGQIIGGGVGGPLKAAGPVQVLLKYTISPIKHLMKQGAKHDEDNPFSLQAHACM